jgi:hypothetical protein
MSLAVVKCPACRAASRVSAEAVGHMVGCPWCQTPFVAEEDIPVVQPIFRPSPRPTAAPERPVSPPRRRRPRPLLEDEDEPAPQPTTAEPARPNADPPDMEHDPHARPVAGLPVSVLVGLALVPFGIPLLWRVAPILIGQGAALSMAVPVSLAIAASALCLGVVYTIDWSAATRIKGVLMLVGLSYLAAAGLFFLKKDLMERLRDWGDETRLWAPDSVKDKNHHFEFKLRGQRLLQPAPGPLPSVFPDGTRGASFQADEGLPNYQYWVSWGKVNDARFKPDDKWFAQVSAHLKQEAQGVDPTENIIQPPDRVTAVRQYTLTFNNNLVRVVRVYVVGNRVYCLYAEGPNLTPEDDDNVKPFFQSFLVLK